MPNSGPHQSSITGGIVGSGLPIEALFWGDWWQTPEGVDRQVLISSRLQTVIASPHFSEIQRSGVAAPHWRGARVVTRPSPPGAFNSTDDEQAVLDLIDALIDDDVFPDPDDEQIAQLVFMPTGFVDTIGANAAHTKDFNADGPFDRDYFWVACVRWFGPVVSKSRPQCQAFKSIRSFMIFSGGVHPRSHYTHAPGVEGRVAPYAVLLIATPQIGRQDRLTFLRGHR
jgi:hypothetical protein